MRRFWPVARMTLKVLAILFVGLVTLCGWLVWVTWAAIEKLDKG